MRNSDGYGMPLSAEPTSAQQTEVAQLGGLPALSANASSGETIILVSATTN